MASDEAVSEINYSWSIEWKTEVENIIKNVVQIKAFQKICRDFSENYLGKLRKHRMVRQKVSL